MKIVLEEREEARRECERQSKFDDTNFGNTRVDAGIAARLALANVVRATAPDKDERREASRNAAIELYKEQTQDADAEIARAEIALQKAHRVRSALHHRAGSSSGAKVREGGDGPASC